MTKNHRLRRIELHLARHADALPFPNAPYEVGSVTVLAESEAIEQAGKAYAVGLWVCWCHDTAHEGRTNPGTAVVVRPPYHLESA